MGLHIVLCSVVVEILVVVFIYYVTSEKAAAVYSCIEATVMGLSIDLMFHLQIGDRWGRHSRRSWNQSVQRFWVWSTFYTIMHAYSRVPIPFFSYSYYYYILYSVRFLYRRDSARPTGFEMNAAPTTDRTSSSSYRYIHIIIYYR